MVSVQKTGIKMKKMRRLLKKVVKRQDFGNYAVNPSEVVCGLEG